MNDEQSPSAIPDEILQTVTSVGVEYGMSVIGGILVLVVGWIVAGWAARTTGRALEKSQTVNQTLVPLARKLVRVTILAVVVIAVLNQFGVQTTSLIAVLGAAGLAIGLSLQGALSNIASGVLLLTLRPFEVGDVIEVGGHVGSVREIGLFGTELTGLDGVYIMLGNSRIWGSDIKNFGRNGTRRIELTIGISYSDDIDKAIALVEDVIAQDKRVLDDPAPLVAVGALGDSSVDLLIRPWTTVADWWPVQIELRKAIKQRFDAEGISIPFPQRDVHLHQVA